MAANETKRGGTKPPSRLSSNSIRYSQATRLSSLLCPCSRWRNRYATSANRYGTGVEAKRSTRILKPWPERRLAARSKAGRDIRKKIAHRIAEFGGDDNPGEASCNPADRDAMAIPLADPTAGRVAAADHYVEVLRLDGAEHLRQHRFVVLQVGIDDRQIRCAAREHAFDDRGSQAAAADALDAADARI